MQSAMLAREVAGMDNRRSLTLRLDEPIFRAYKVLLAEEGLTIQEDLERYVLQRLREAGRLPEDAQDSDQDRRRGP